MRKKDAYGWWRRRLRLLERYFSAVRVDHILGFFRIWELPYPEGVTGLMGRFRPALPITREELERRGLWDVARLTEPRVDRRALRQAFRRAVREVREEAASRGEKGDPFDPLADLVPFAGGGGVSGAAAASAAPPPPEHARPRARASTAEELADDAAARFFVDKPGCGGRLLEFRPAWRTERALQEGLSPRAGGAAPRWLRSEAEATRRALRSLLQNVLLLRDPRAPSTRFYPRIGLSGTASFRDLGLEREGEGGPGGGGGGGEGGNGGGSKNGGGGNGDAWRSALHELHEHHLHRQNLALWRAHARRTIPGALLSSTSMLVCGEDLGFVPACVPPTLAELGIVGLRIQRMPPPAAGGGGPDEGGGGGGGAGGGGGDAKAGGERAGGGGEFDDPSRYPYMTVASPSCHDVAPLRMWYEADPARAERFWATLGLSSGAGGGGGGGCGGVGGGGGGASAVAAAASASAAALPSLAGVGSFCSASSLAHPPHPDPTAAASALSPSSSPADALLPGGAPRRCTPEVARAVLQQHASSPSLLAVFPLQDVFALSDRVSSGRDPREECINDPTVRRHYWRWRMHLPLEALCRDAELVALVQEVLLLGDRVSPAELAEARAGVRCHGAGGV